MSKHYRSEKHAEAVRLEACRCAAVVLAHRPDLDFIPHAHAMCVFFESYIFHGSDFTRKPFGGKEPVKLRVVKG